LGYSISSQALVDAGAIVLRPVPMFVIGTLLLASVLMISLAGTGCSNDFSTRFFRRNSRPGVLMVVFLNASHDGFVSTFNAAMKVHVNLDNAYAAIIQQAQSHGLQTNQPTDFRSALLALPIGYWAFIGFTYSAYVAEKSRNRRNRKRLGSLGR